MIKGKKTLLLPFIGLFIIVSLIFADLFLTAETQARQTYKESSIPYFDLVVYGKNLDSDNLNHRLKTNVEHGDNWSKIPWASFKTGERDLFVIRHLSTEKFIGRDIRENYLEIFLQNRQGENAEIKAIYAFPHTSKPSKNYPDVLKSVIENQPMEAKDHSLANYIHPQAQTIKPNHYKILKVEAPVRYKKPGILEVEWVEKLYRY